MAAKKIVVIGAGIGGMAAAVRLAAAGHAVQVFEAAAQPGGKMSQVAEAGFRWDTGPSVITMRPVLEALFTQAGSNLNDYLELLPVEPLTRYFYPDGTQLDATANLSRMAQQIEQIAPRDVEGYLAYLAYAARIYRITGPGFIYGDAPNLLHLLGTTPPGEWLHVDPLRTMQQAINGYVRSRHLRQLLGRFATYVGASPYLAPATLNVIAHVELTGGVWYPRGGVYSIARALAQVAAELGVRFEYGCPVERIAVKVGQAQGVHLAGGNFTPADAVLSNVDVTTTYQRLLPSEVGAARGRWLADQPPSCSGFALLLGVEGQHQALAHHNIFFSDDYPREFRQIFEEGVPPTEPTVYAAITSKTDPDHAPAEHENWFVLVNAPPTGRFDWQHAAQAYRDVVLGQLARHGFDLRGRIVTEHIITPPELAQRSGAWRGALYGPASNSRMSAFKRPNNRAPEVENLYFAGGTTHPGGGVPMVMLSGAAAARMIIEKLR